MSNSKFTIPNDFTECYFVLHTDEDDEGFAESLYVRPLKGFRRKDNETSSFDFYGIRGSSYGIKIPPLTAGWALVHNHKGNLTTLASSTIPDPGMTQRVELSDGRMVHVRRANVNLFFTVTAQPSVFHKIPLKVFNSNA